jgi:hypothetical protein
VLNGEATNTDVMVFALTRKGLEPTIYHTRREYPNHYTAHAVKNRKEARHSVFSLFLFYTIQYNTIYLESEISKWAFKSNIKIYMHKQ